MAIFQPISRKSPQYTQQGTWKWDQGFHGVQAEPPGVFLILFLSPFLTGFLGSDIYQMEKDIAIEQERNARYRPPKILEPTAFQEPPPKVSQAQASMAP